VRYPAISAENAGPISHSLYLKFLLHTLRSFLITAARWDTSRATNNVPIFVRKTESPWHAEFRRSSLLSAFRGKVPAKKSFLPSVIGTFNNGDQAVTEDCWVQDRHIDMIKMANSKSVPVKPIMAAVPSEQILSSSLKARFQFKKAYILLFCGVILD
jgi:hypothetical protein